MENNDSGISSRFQQGFKESGFFFLSLSRNERGIVKHMESFISDYLHDELIKHKDYEETLFQKRNLFYQKRYSSYLSMGREEEEAKSQIRKEIKAERRKRDTPDLSSLKTLSNVSLSGLLRGRIEVLTLYFTKNLSSLSVFVSLFFFVYLFCLILLILRKIQFSIPNLVSLILMTLSTLVTVIESIPFITVYRDKIFIPSYVFPGYVIGKEWRQDGSEGRTKSIFLTDFLIAFFLFLFFLFLCLEKKRQKKNDIHRKLLRFEED